MQEGMNRLDSWASWKGTCVLDRVSPLLGHCEGYSIGCNACRNDAFITIAVDGDDVQYKIETRFDRDSSLDDIVAVIAEAKLDAMRCEVGTKHWPMNWIFCCDCRKTGQA